MDVGAEGLCVLSQSNIEVLKTKLIKSWAGIDVETVRATCNQVISCLRRVIAEKGRYIE